MHEARNIATLCFSADAELLHSICAYDTMAVGIEFVDLIY